MAWDFRNYVKQYYDFIEEGDDGKYVVKPTNRLRLHNIIQMKKTEYTKKYQTRLDERHYNKIKD